MVRSKYNFVNSFWMKTDMDSVAYCRIRMWNQIEKTNENRIRMYPLYYHIKFKYGYGYPYWCLSGYGCRIIWISAIRFLSLITRVAVDVSMAYWWLGIARAAALRDDWEFASVADNRWIDEPVDRMDADRSRPTGDGHRGGGRWRVDPCLRTTAHKPI